MTRIRTRKLQYLPAPICIIDADLLDVFDLDRDNYEWLDCRANRTADLPAWMH
jgi:hypothetical protein